MPKNNWTCACCGKTQDMASCGGWLEIKVHGYTRKNLDPLTDVWCSPSCVRDHFLAFTLLDEDGVG